MTSNLADWSRHLSIDCRHSSALLLTHDPHPAEHNGNPEWVVNNGASSGEQACGAEQEHSLCALVLGLPPPRLRLRGRLRRPAARISASSEGAKLHLRVQVLVNHVGRVDHVELLRGVLPGKGDDGKLATRVVLQEVSDIEHLAVQNHPAGTL